MEDKGSLQEKPTEFPLLNIAMSFSQLVEKLKTSKTKVFKPRMEKAGNEEYFSLSASNLFG